MRFAAYWRKGAAALMAAIAALLAGALAEESQYQRDAEAAQAYADAYSARDIDALSALLADDAVFEDPSSRFEGKDAIAAGLSEVFGRITSTGPESKEINKYRSGNDFVFMGWADFNMMMAIGDQPEREFNFKLDFMMTLRIDNGKVTEHRDYLDTEAFLSQLQAQLNSAEKSN